MSTNMQGLKIPTGYSLNLSIQNKNKNVGIYLSDWGYIFSFMTEKMNFVNCLITLITPNLAECQNSMTGPC